MKKGASVDPRTVIERKDLAAVLHQFLAKNVPQLAAALIRAPVVQAILELFEEYCPPADRMKAGEVLWYAVDENETAGYGKRIEDCKLVPVTLELVNTDDAKRITEGMKRRQRNIHVTARLFNQAYEQGGVLTQADVAAIMRLTPGTIGKYLKDYELQTNEVLPRRGTIHDMGPTLTHKRIICIKHFREGKSIEQTARESYHSVSAVTRYVQDYKRVKTCIDEDFAPDKIRMATGLSKSLIQQYIDIINKKDLHKLT